MSTTKVSALAAKGTLGGSEEILINDGGTSKKATITAVRTGVTDATKLPLAGGQMTGNITMAGSQTVDGRDISADGTQLDTNTSAIATKAPIANPTFTGTVAIPNISDLESAVTANTAKVTNATHTGDVTGATTLTIAADAVTGAKIADDSIDSEHIVDGSIDTAHIGDDQVTADKLANSINTDIATGVTANTTANNALPKAGGTMTGDLILGDNVKLEVGSASGGDLQIYHDGSTSYIYNTEGSLILQDTNGQIYLKPKTGASGVDVLADGAVKLYHDNSKKLETTANGVTITGTGIATTNTDTTNTGSVTLDFAANQNFVLTLTGNVTLANPSTEQVGQSGFITFIQDSTGSRTVSLGTDYETAGGAGLTLTSTASATDIVPYVVVASGRILLGTPQLAFA